MIDFGDKWSSVIFGDEKKFNLDGPDGFQCYWKDLRKEKDIFSKRQNGGASVMTWAGFSELGKTDLAFVEGNQKSHNCIYTLSEYLLSFAYKMYGCDFIFQQDNAAIHTSGETKMWLNENNLSILD